MGTVSQLLDDLKSHCSSPPQIVENFLAASFFQSNEQNQFSKPMVWIGIYIAIASLFCILPMVADLIHGFKSKKLWFPCKYFTLNAVSLTVIAVAMKLPMDLNNSMPKSVDQAAKLGSMAFMCTMMANLLPSLATMDSKELLTTIIALGILVITLVVNVCIQMGTGVVSSFIPDNNKFVFSRLTYNTWLIANLYVAMLLASLMIHTCSGLMIIKAKQILESKYKAGHETALKDVDLQQAMVEKLKHHVSNQWIMAGTGSPQFMIVSTATTSASGVICVSSTALHVITMLHTREDMMDCGSDYKWSVVVILITQFTGSSIPFKFSSRKCKIFIQELKILTLNLCIKIQKMVVIACKMITLIPIFFVIGAMCCFQCWKWLKVIFSASNSVLVERPDHLQHNIDLSPYILQLQDDMELAERTLKSISESLNHVIQKAEEQKPNYLMMLLEESSGFAGVGKYDEPQVPPITEEKYMDCWSLPIVTLTAIAISLPSIQNNMVDRLLRSVSEGLTYVKHVEETLNSAGEYAIVQKAARTLWLEIEVYHKWLGYKLPSPAHQVNTPKEIVQRFSDTAEYIVTENMNGSDDSSLYTSISANSMYRISQTILVSHHADIDQVSQEDLFGQLSSMISDILAACLTNLPKSF
ncbi:uncharacterized protein LOC143628035 [Bidens hawaiensis]|uniref:uncharacterized protein LOC143628035 n=1 Tax=Bidens hawaiensis TaxID=980011 RepID=UPI00404B8CF5